MTKLLKRYAAGAYLEPLRPGAKVVGYGERIRVRFSLPGYGGWPLGEYRGLVVSPWSGHPRPSRDETWEVEVITYWQTGCMVRPLKKVTD